MNDPQEDNAPDVVSPGLTEPPPQPPTQPSVEARPDLLPPAHPPQSTPPVQYPPGPYAQGPYAPGPYAAPMPLPPKPRHTGTLWLVVLVAVLMIGGGLAGYVMFGDSGEASSDVTDNSGAESGGAEETTGAGLETAGPHETPSAFEFSGETIPVESLGAEMPVPSANWELVAGPGEDGADLTDMASYTVEYEEGWYANLLVGRYNVAGMPFAPETMAATAIELTGFWAGESAAGGVNGVVTEPSATELQVNGHAAVIAEAKASWDSIEYSADLYERVITFLVDVDGVNAFYVQAWVPESADAEYEALIAALEATTFLA